MKRLAWSAYLLGWILAPPDFAPAEPLSVFVSIVPQLEIVQQIGRENVQVQVMVPPGANPHVYEPRPAQMAALSKARLYFSTGIAFEKVWLPKFAALHPGLTVAATDQGIRKRPMDHHDHPGKDRHEDPDTFDPHVWLAPPLIKIMAGNIRNALVAADPAHAAEYDRQHAALAAALDQLDLRLRELLADVKGGRFMVFHPSWGYFAQTYGLIQVPIEVEGREPKPAQLQQLIQRARQENIRVIFVQPQFSTRSAQTIAEATGSRIVTADPLAADLMDQLLHLAQAIKSGAKP